MAKPTTLPSQAKPPAAVKPLSNPTAMAPRKPVSPSQPTTVLPPEAPPSPAQNGLGKASAPGQLKKIQNLQNASTIARSMNKPSEDDKEPLGGSMINGLKSKMSSLPKPPAFRYRRAKG